MTWVIFTQEEKEISIKTQSKYISPLSIPIGLINKKIQLKDSLLRLKVSRYILFQEELLKPYYAFTHLCQPKNYKTYKLTRWLPIIQ